MVYNNAPIVESDLVLIHIENKPGFYARVESITADVKPKWWEVKFLFLTVPLQVATWIVDDNQIRGDDFTMGGTPIRIEKVKVPEDAQPAEPAADENEADDTPVIRTKKVRVLSLGDRRKGKEK